jgi:hypothetical protein
VTAPRTMFDKIWDAHVVALTLTHEAAISAFEDRRRAEAPWLYG